MYTIHSPSKSDNALPDWLEHGVVSVDFVLDCSDSQQPRASIRNQKISIWPLTVAAKQPEALSTKVSS